MALACSADVVQEHNAPGFDAGGAWTIRNFNGVLRIDTAAVECGTPCLAVCGASNTCDTAVSLLSRKIPLAAGAKEFVVSLETKGTFFAQDKFSPKGPWNNAVIWYGADGQEVRVDPLDHVLVPSGASFHEMRDWGRIPKGAAACSVRLGFDNPNLLKDHSVCYRNFRFETVPVGQSREAEFAAAWKDGAWLRDVLYSDNRPRVPKITLRDDGVTLVDGEPFFPIGVYSVCKREFNNQDFDRAFADLKAAGFNFAHTYGDAYEPGFFDAAEKYGFKLWVAAKLPDRKLLDVGRRRPCVLAWYLGDDTASWFSPQEITDRHVSVKAVDPNRLTCQADPIDSDLAISRYAAYVRATDVFMPEIYPVRHEAGDPTDKTCVAITIRDMERVRSDVRSFNDGQPRACWPIIQYFLGWNGWQHFPSRDQLFAMTWAAIIHGAHGMTWYTYGGFDHKKPGRNDQGITSTPERWQTISELARELGKWSPVFVERTPAEQPTVKVLEGPRLDPLGKEPSVTCLLKKHAGKTHLFAVNACSEPVTVEFTLPGGVKTTEKFAPFGVLAR